MTEGTVDLTQLKVELTEIQRVKPDLGDSTQEKLTKRFEELGYKRDGYYRKDQILNF